MSFGRRRLTAPIDVGDTIAVLPSTGDAATPGDVQLSTTAISNAVVDNINYDYTLQCAMDPSGTIALYGATVEYTLTGAQGAAA